MTPEERRRAARAVVDVLPNYLAGQGFEARVCVLGCRVGRAALRELGIATRPLAVGLLAMNAVAAEFAHGLDRLPTEEELEALGERGGRTVLIGYGVDDPTARGWDGHLVLTMRNPDLTLDLTVGQADRPHKSIRLPAALAIDHDLSRSSGVATVEVPPPEGEEGVTALAYVARPDDRSYRRGGDWNRWSDEVATDAARVAALARERLAGATGKLSVPG